MQNKKLNKAPFNFVDNGKWYMLASAIVIALGLLVTAIFGLNLGLDFTGGSMIELEVGSSLSDSTNYNNYKKTIEDVFKENGVKISSLQKQGENTQASIVIKFQDVDNKDMNQLIETIKTNIVDKFESEHNLETKIIASEQITGSASSSLVWKAVVAILISIILMMIYIAVRFEFYSGLCTLIGLVHDVFIMVALTAFLRIPVNSAFIAAIITVIAYSINSNIVIFDRVRELYHKNSSSELKFREIVDSGIKQTLTRTVFTTITTLFAVILLTFFGVSSMREFVVPIMFGIAAGAYSSIFIVGALFAQIADKRGVRFRKRLSATKV